MVLIGVDNNVGSSGSVTTGSIHRQSGGPHRFLVRMHRAIRLRPQTRLAIHERLDGISSVCRQRPINQQSSPEKKDGICAMIHGMVAC